MPEVLMPGKVGQLDRSGEPGQRAMTILELHSVESSTGHVIMQTNAFEVLAFGAPAEAAEAGRRAVSRFPRLLNRLAHL